MCDQRNENKETNDYNNSHNQGAGLNICETLDS